MINLDAISEKLLKLKQEMILTVSGGLSSGLYYTIEWKGNLHNSDEITTNDTVSIRYCGSDIELILKKFSKVLDREIKRQDANIQIGNLREKYGI